MKSILSAVALLAALAAPALAEEAAQPQAQPAILLEEAATAPATNEAQPVATGEAMQSEASKGGHGCGAKNTVYLTN